MIVFSPPKTVVPTKVYILINQGHIKHVETTLFLGVILNSNFSWNIHIEYVSRTISRSIAILN